MPQPEADYEIDIDWNEGVPKPAKPAPPAASKPAKSRNGTAPASVPAPMSIDDEDDDEDEFAPLPPISVPAPAASNGKGPAPGSESQASIPNETDRELAAVHAQAARADGAPMITEGEVIEDHDMVELKGKKFRVAEKIGLMPLLKYASAADMSTDDPRALAAVYMMLKDCIYEGSKACGECDQCKAGRDVMCKSFDAGDWRAFEDHAVESKADAEELLPVISQVMEIVSGRPTRQRDGSSDTPRTTRRVSTGNSSSGKKGASRR